MSEQNDGNVGKVRVNGPYKHGRKWRVVEVRGDGEVATLSFEVETEARAYVEAARRVAVGINLGAAVTEYITWLQEAPGRGGRARRDSTVKLVAWRLRGLLRCGEDEDYPLWGLTRAKARALFARREAEVRVDTLAGELATVHRASAWWVKKGWLDADPFVGCEVKGSRAVGKPQLRANEARRFLQVALQEGVPGLACALALLTGMRASEITGLTVRDVDDGTLWITRAKTRRGERRLTVPTLLMPRIAELCAGRKPDEPLWGEVDRHWLYHRVIRICGLAGVPEVTPHGLRGTWATLAVGVIDTNAAAAALGHDPKMTREVYAAPGAEQSGQASRVAAELGGQHVVQVDSRDRGEPGAGSGRAGADARDDAGRHDAGIPVFVRARVEGEGAVGTGPGRHREGAGILVGGGQDRSGLGAQDVHLPAGEGSLASGLPETSVLVTTTDESLPGRFDLSDVLLN